MQRAELLDAILADLYGAQKLLARRQLPVPAVLDHDEYLRHHGRHRQREPVRLFMVAVDLGRGRRRPWKVISDRTQAPSGAGYAMQNRRVVSRVMPEVYHAAHLHRLTPFFQAMRTALVDAAPAAGGGPAGRRAQSRAPTPRPPSTRRSWPRCSGFPLVEGRDLTVRDGRVWMRVLGKLEQVDVILRRVDSIWMDALELRPGPGSG